MKILVYGDGSPASGGWCYAETLKELGHEVSMVLDTIGLECYKKSFVHRLYRKVFGIREADRRKHVKLLESKVDGFGPEIVIILKGLHLAKKDINRLRAKKCWICNINHDDFYSANPNNWSLIQRAAIPAYDYIFTTREVNVEEVRPLNARVEFFPFAYFPRIHHPVAVPLDEEEKWICDVVFVGTYERPRAALLEGLIRKTGVDLVIHGSQWSKLSSSSPLRKCIRSSDLRFDDLAKAIGGARIALGFLRKENRDDYTQRTFEIPACGGVFLAERTQRHLDYYKEGVEAEFFGSESLGELCEKVILLLNNPKHREGVRIAGQRAVCKGRHTYRDRLSRLIQVYDETSGARRLQD